MQTIQRSERQLADKKQQLESFQTEFIETKKKYEEACKRLESDIKETIELMQVTQYTLYICTYCFSVLFERILELRLLF